jgi:hypothetical protein
MFDWIGWVASAIFASSYFCKQPGTLRRVQALAAVMWMTYGFLIHAMPVIVANMVVAGVALYSSFRSPAQSAVDPRQDSGQVSSALGQ